jgi:sporulation protein YlmC with PRC-barrel domain
MKANKIDGMQVVTSDATTIGEVNGTEIDTKKWHLTNLYVELDNEAAVKLDLKKPIIGHVTICIPVEKIEAVGDVITLNKTLEQLKEISPCD